MQHLERNRGVRRYLPVFPATLIGNNASAGGWVPAQQRKGFVLQARARLVGLHSCSQTLQMT